MSLWTEAEMREALEMLLSAPVVHPNTGDTRCCDWARDTLADAIAELVDARRALGVARQALLRLSSPSWAVCDVLEDLRAVDMDTRDDVLQAASAFVADMSVIAKQAFDATEQS